MNRIVTLYVTFPDLQEAEQVIDALLDTVSYTHLTLPTICSV